MKTHRKRQIFHSLCKSYKHDDGTVDWHTVAKELRKLPTYKKPDAPMQVCDKCGK